MNEVAVTALAAPIPKSGSLQIGNQVANLARHGRITLASSAAKLTLGAFGCKARFMNQEQDGTEA